MPKLKENQVPSYRLHKQSGQAIVTLSGRDHLLGTYNTKASKTEYDRLISEWVANGRRADYRNVEGVSISRIIAEFWAHAKTYYVLALDERHSEAENFKWALQPLRRLYGSLDASEFGPKKLAAVQQEMIKLGWTRKHINRQVARIKQVFKWAVAQEMVPASVYQALATVPGLRKGKSAAREATPIKAVPEACVEQTIQHVGPTVEAMIRVQLLTGMRSGELVIMRTEDIDRTGNVWMYRPRRHKTEHHEIDRDIQIGPKAQKILAKYLKTDPHAFIFSPADSERSRRERLHEARSKATSGGNVPGSNRVKNPKRAPRARYTVASYRKAIERACNAAFPPPEELARKRVKANGRKKHATRWETPKEWKERLGAEAWAKLMAWRKAQLWKPHQLRHTAATNLRREFGFEIARIVLGHQSAAITQIYAEADVKKATHAMALVG